MQVLGSTGVQYWSRWISKIELLVRPELKCTGLVDQGCTLIRGNPGLVQLITDYRLVNL